jgi:hypothetical protein
VEPGEVEEALRRHASVRECAVIPREASGGARILAAYVVACSGRPDLEALRTYLQERLPEYLVPSSFVALDSLPKAPNGKLDIRALPAPADDVRRARTAVPPRDAVEQQLVRIWEDVLGVKPIGIHDRFLDLGGHSLLVIRMLAEVERKFGRKVPAAILFEAPTVALLAGAIRREGLVASRSLVVEIQPEGTRPPIFWMHTLGGGGGAGLFFYEKLARLLGPDQPSYGIIATDGQQPGTMEALAARYVGEIRAVQPTGPYYLGGYCFGGVLAHEVGRQLAAAGEEIAAVILLDAAPPALPGMPGVLSTAFFQHVCRTLPNWIQASFSEGGAVKQRVKFWGGMLANKVRQRLGLGAGTTTGPKMDAVINMDRYPEEFRAHAEAHWRALAAYQPRAFPPACCW